MNYATQFSKLLELRAKTDRQLGAYLKRRLVKGMRSALEAAETGAPEAFDNAIGAYAEARGLVPGLRGAEERRRVERELARLRCLLDETEMSPAQAGAA